MGLGANPQRWAALVSWMSLGANPQRDGSHGSHGWPAGVAQIQGLARRATPRARGTPLFGGAEYGREEAPQG